MAAGDLRGKCEVIPVTAGATVVKGDVVHIEMDDGKWDPVVDTDTGKFGVAITGGADTETIWVVVKGKVDVTASAAAIKKGAYVIAASTGMVATVGTISETTVMGTLVGMAEEAFGSSGVQCINVGLVG